MHEVQDEVRLQVVVRQAEPPATLSVCGFMLARFWLVFV